MKIHIKLLGSLHIDLGLDSGTIELTPKKGTKVGELVKELGLNPEEVWLVVVNDVRVSADYSVKNGDSVVIVPPVTGG